MVRATLERLRRKLPDAITGLRFEQGPDSTGDEAIWVWVEIPDDAPDEVWSWESRQQMRDAIRGAIEAVGLEPWVYVRFTEPVPASGVA
jgi:hypothetical protein